VITAGSWAYAITAPFTGAITDNIGGKRGFLIACIGSGFCNILLGILFFIDIPASVMKILYNILFALNVAIQGFGTSAVSKINSEWYDHNERGIFSGIFNIVLTSGYYLALGTGSSILNSIGFPYLFIIPGAILCTMSVLVIFVVANKPTETIYSSVMPKSTNRRSSADKHLRAYGSLNGEHLTRKQKTILLLKNATFLGYLMAMFFLCWVRDGFLNWMFSYFNSVRADALTPEDTAIIGGTWTLGGFIGGVLCGWISDHCFHSNRVKPIAIFSFLQAILFVIIYMLASDCSIGLLGVLVCICSVAILGNYTLLGFTIPIDLPPHISAGASGIMTAVGYFATGIANVFMGNTVETYGYIVWIVSLVVAALLSGIFTVLGSYCATRSQSKSNEQSTSHKWPKKSSIMQVQTRSEVHRKE